MLFPVWALISGVTAFLRPATLAWMTTQQFEWGVGLLMLAMGLSLTKEDFRKVGKFCVCVCLVATEDIPVPPLNACFLPELLAVCCQPCPNPGEYCCSGCLE
jgi:predicted Na+-dependent transporter